MAPLLPVVETEMGLGHGQAGSFFFFVAVGYGVGLLGSGWASSVLTHRLTIAAAGMLGGAALILISQCSSMSGIRCGLVLVGIFAGLYLPSGISTLTELVPREHWGKAMAIHELAPSLAFTTTPLIAEFLLKFFSWRGALIVLASAAVVMPVIFLLYGRGIRGRGDPPTLRLLGEVASKPVCWGMGVFFMVSIGSSYGAYTMMPLFLVAGLGMERPWANTLIGLSRTFSIAALFVSGWMIDRMGPRLSMTVFLISTGAFTLLLGLVREPAYVAVLVFCQAASVACLFPIGFTIVSLLFPQRLRGVAVSLVILIGFLLGGGMVPSAIGYWAESFSFSSAFALLGVIGLLLLPLFLRMGSGLNLSR